MMSGDEPFWSGMADMMNDGYADHPWVAGAVPRLGIPGVRFADGPRGVIMDGGTTFPVSMGRAPPLTPELEERVGDVIGRELRAMGGNFFGGVCINLLRHPAWGRAQETYGEDPIHLGEFGAALVRGVQKHVMACAKHYALNSMENARFSVDVSIEPRPLHEIYLRHFKRVVEEGVASIMSAYNSVNGEWCGQNYTLLTEILKQQWGFEGFVMTDFIFGMRDSKESRPGRAGCGNAFRHDPQPAPERAGGAGEVPLERIDDAALRVPAPAGALCAGPQPAGLPAGGVRQRRHTARWRAKRPKNHRAAEERGRAAAAEKGGAAGGDWRLAIRAQHRRRGLIQHPPGYVVTPLQGIQEALQDQAEIVYDDGADPTRAAQVAAAADVVVLVVGYTSADEGEYISPDTMAELSKNFPPPTEADMPFAQKMMSSASAFPSEVNTMPPGGDRRLLTLHPADEALILAVAEGQPEGGGGDDGRQRHHHRELARAGPGHPHAVVPGHGRRARLCGYPAGQGEPERQAAGGVCQTGRRPAHYEIDAKHITYDLWHGYRKLMREAVPRLSRLALG
jgi:beta-glucosidase